MVAATTTVSISAEPPKQPRRLKPAETALVTVWLLALTGAMVIALLSLWPLAEQVQLAAQKTTASTTPTPEPPQLDLVIAHLRLTPGLSIIVIGMSSGVLGSLVHTFTWLNQSSRGPSPTPRHKTHRPHDVVWFITAPLQGGLLALLVISAVSAGLLSTGQAQAATTVSLFTVVAIGGPDRAVQPAHDRQACAAREPGRAEEHDDDDHHLHRTRPHDDHDHHRSTAPGPGQGPAPDRRSAEMSTTEVRRPSTRCRSGVPGAAAGPGVPAGDAAFAAPGDGYLPSIAN